MIWLIGNQGMLGTEVETLLRRRRVPYFASDKEVDITDPDALRRFASGRSLTWIINCSAYTAVDQAEDEPEAAFAINADGPGHLAALAREKNARLLHISTDYVFDGTRAEAYRESDPPSPIGVYGRSKYQGEVNIINTLAEHIIVRTAWLYGHHGPSFVATMLRLFHERPEVRVVNDQYGSPTCAPDLAAAILTIIEGSTDQFGIYHFTNEGRATWHDFAREIYHQAREHQLVANQVVIRGIPAAEYPTRAQRPANACLSKKKIKNTFALTIRPWQDGLADYFDTYQTQSLNT